MFAAALALVAAACGDSDAGDSATTAPTTADSQATTAAPEDGGSSETTATTAGESGGGQEPTSTEATDAPPVVDGPAAPDFALALGSGETFVLSDEQKPVYLVFWAEW